MQATTRTLASEFRDQITSALIAVHERAHMAGVARALSQEELACAMVAALSEAMGLLLSEAFKNDQERLVEVFPRCEDIIRKTAERMWKVHHVPDCDCPDVYDD